MEGLTTATSVTKITEISDVASTISWRKYAAATAEQSENAVAEIDAIADPQSFLHDHRVPTLLDNVDLTLNMTRVYNSTTFEASKAFPNSITQHNQDVIPLDFKVNDGTCESSNFVLGLTSTTKTKANVEKTPLVMFKTMLGMEPMLLTNSSFDNN
ncbi:hypothetical protein ACH5RR_025902 [Cinchona calisaya]|uniref:Uncharacterized protein n=1 Tax=Cinchona calisaya TaxID=153742 RepID=A0ABD2Z0Y5_9GENT